MKKTVAFPGVADPLDNSKQKRNNSERACNSMVAFDVKVGKGVEGWIEGVGEERRWREAAKIFKQVVKI